MYQREIVCNIEVFVECMFDDLLFSKSHGSLISNCSTCVLPFIWWQVDLPTGGKLSSCGLQLLGLSGLGSSGGFERLHHL